MSKPNGIPIGGDYIVCWALYGTTCVQPIIFTRKLKKRLIRPDIEVWKRENWTCDFALRMDQEQLGEMDEKAMIDWAIKSVNSFEKARKWSGFEVPQHVSEW